MVWLGGRQAWIDVHRPFMSWMLRHKLSQSFWVQGQFPDHESNLVRHRIRYFVKIVSSHSFFFCFYKWWTYNLKGGIWLIRHYILLLIYFSKLFSYYLSPLFFLPFSHYPFLSLHFLLVLSVCSWSTFLSLSTTPYFTLSTHPPLASTSFFWPHSFFLTSLWMDRGAH